MPRFALCVSTAAFEVLNFFPEPSGIVQYTTLSPPFEVLPVSVMVLLVMGVVLELLTFALLAMLLFLDALPPFTNPLLRVLTIIYEM